MTETLSGLTVAGRSRRNLLSMLAGGCLPCALPPLWGNQRQQRGAERPTSLILVWLAGGASQLETWDPHPGTAAGGETQAIPTRIPDLLISDLYPQVAEQIDALSVIRSLVSSEGDHERATYFVKTGYRPVPALKHPAVGATLARMLLEDAVAIPRHISLGNSPWPARGGFLGPAYDAFKVYAPGRSIPNMRAPVRGARQNRRLENLQILSREFRQQRQRQVAATQHQEMVARALRMMDSEQLQAFEIKEESRALRDRYGDTDFGRGCLVARRLVERGVRAVEVTLGGFDSHVNNFAVHRERANVLDPAFATLIGDLRDRELLESTLILCIGEFGRTPGINPLEGRDHWPTGFSCLVGGGGLRAGLVIGQTDPEGKQKQPKDPIHVPDLYATLFQRLGLDPRHEVVSPIGRPIRLSEGKPIARLLGTS